MQIEIYSKDNCAFCVRAKNLLAQKGLNYVEYNMNRNYTREEFLAKFPNAKTVPQIVIDGTTVGGFDKLEEWVVNYDKSRFLQD